MLPIARHLSARARLIRALVAGVAVVLSPTDANAASRTPTVALAPVRTPSLTGGAPSIDALIDRLLAGVAANDPASLRALRVTEDEYVEIIVPLTVLPGQPPRPTSAKSAAYMWRSLETRSNHFTQALLDEFGGRKLTLTSRSFTKEPRTFAGYTAYGKLRLDVTDAGGRTGVLRSGTIVELNGRYKFIGLNWDD